MDSDGSLPEVAELGALDYVVIASLLLFSSGVGLYYRFTGGKQTTLKVFIISYIPVTILIKVSIICYIPVTILIKVSIICCIPVTILIKVSIICYTPATILTSTVSVAPLTN